MVDAWASLSGKRLKSDAIENNAANSAASKGRVRKGEVPSHIDAILKEGGEYEEPELRKAIKDKFGVDYQRATVYTCLRRGLNDRYTQQGKKWSWNPMKVAQKA